MAITELHTVVRRCIRQRMDADVCQQVLELYRVQHPFTNLELVAAILNASLSLCVEGDPRLPLYIHEFLLKKSFNLLDLMRCLIRAWASISKTRRDNVQKMILVQTQMLSSLHFLPPADEAEKCVSLAARWLAVLVDLAKSSAEANITGLTEAVGFLLASLATPVNLRRKKTYAEVQRALDECMTSFPNISMQLMDKLSTVPKPDSYENDAASPNTLNIAAYQFETNISEAPIIPVRSATTLYLNWLLRSCATMDDSIIYSFLSARFQGIRSVMFSELLFASFDAMQKVPEKTNEIYHQQCQFFILNKLPSILMAFIVTSAFDTFSSEEIIVGCWHHLSASGSPEAVSLGNRFLQICAFHHLISTEKVSSLVPDSNTGLKGLYAKDELVNQCAANHSRGPRLVDELLKNDGNGGTIAQAITEIMHNYCMSKDTQHLKDISNALARKPAAINVIGLFIRPSAFLAPFCNLLDEWKWSEIHGESQPVYDEFGSVLLLILAVKERLQLKNSELGIQQKDGFLARYLASADSEHELSRLPDSSNKYLGDWIQSLYIDEGLSDDLTTSCSAHDFYLLVPTLIRQSVMARSKGKLTTESWKAGLEYLLEPFLLPSLLTVLGWVTRIATIETKTAVEVLKVFTKTPANTEARELHNTILSVAVSQMTLYGVRRLPAIDAVLKNLNIKDFNLREPTRQSESMPEDVEHLANHIARAATGSEVLNCNLLETAIQSWGPKKVVHAFIDLLIQFSGSSDFHSIVDLEATITSLDGDLRLSLQLVHANLASFLKEGNNLFAEASVHLSRRVDLYSHALSARNLGVDHGFVPMAGMNMASINLDAGPAPTFEANEQTQDQDIDQVLNEAAALDGLDSVNATNFDDMYDFQTGDIGLDDLDLDMF